MVLELPDQIEKFKEFFDVNESYMTLLHDQVRGGHLWLNVEFADIARHSPELADMILDQPDELLKAWQIAIDKMDLPRSSDDAQAHVEVRLTNLPKQQHLQIKNIRSKHLNKFVQIQGIVRQKSPVRPQVTSARFECPSCGNILHVLQADQKFKEPTRCGCGRKGHFKMLSKELVDAQSITLEEATEDLDGGEQPKRLKLFLKNDLVAPLTDKRTNPGAKITVIGNIKEVPIILAQGGQSTTFDLILDTNFIDSVQEDFTEININTEEEEQIKVLSQDPDLLEKFVASIAPSVYGHEPIKQALILQMFGGVHKARDKGVKARGDIHILLIGDPGSGKSTLLKRISGIAPKARFVSGKGVSGAGLTASVVKDDFLKGWTLEAGAMVLANKGLLAVDELDKMSDEDTSALHEALEQQCYHPKTEIMFADGSTRMIGNLVDELLAQQQEKVIRRKDCEILEVDDVVVLTTDFETVFPIATTCVSRRKAPDRFVNITYSNGRSITVTPEHPIFIFDDKLRVVAAEKVKEGLLAPAARTLPTYSSEPKMIAQELTHCNNKLLITPQEMGLPFARLLGYIITEGHSYRNLKRSYAEIGVSNTDKKIAEECYSLFSTVFHTSANMNFQSAESKKKATLDLYTARCPSLILYSYFEKNFPKLLHKAPLKRMDDIIKSAPPELKLELLRSAFKGDGFIDSERFGYVTASYGLAKDYQDLLLQQGIYSIIATENRQDKKYFKIVISGSSSMQFFFDSIVEEDDKRRERISNFCKRSTNRKNDRNIIPASIVKEVYQLLLDFRLADGYFYNNIVGNQNAHRETMSKYLKLVEKHLKKCQEVLSSNNTRLIRRMLYIQAENITEELGICSATILNYEKNKENKRYENLLLVVKRLGRDKLDHAKRHVQILKEIVESDIRFVQITSVEIIPNKDVKWVYDLQIDPTHNFISEGLVLHNSVSIAKANIQATLRCETTVLAAANPKFGRFDPYELISKQIDLPPTLLNRFDLIFPVRDLPDRNKDEKLASFILSLHKEESGQEGMIDPEMIKKYVSYARQRCIPKLTEGAIIEIRDYYVKMRGGDEKGEPTIKAIPISARQLEALVRLSEASAKMRLSDKVTKRDAQTAIELVHFCLQQIGMDPDTGKIDIDRITTGITASQRSHISLVKEIIQELEATIGKMIPIEDVVREAGIKGVAEDTAHDVIEKLKRGGDIYSPKHGFVARL